MLDIFEQYATDETRENNGTWVEHGTAKFLIARTGNRKYVEMLSSEVEKNKNLLEGKGDDAAKLSDQIMINVIAETILMGWEGVGYRGKPLPYTKDNARMALQVKDFRRKVTAWADDAANYKVKLEAEQLGN